ATAGVVINDIVRERQSAGSAHYRQSLPLAKSALAGARCGGQVEVHVVGDEKVQEPVAVVIEKATAGPETDPRDRKLRLCSRIFERAVSAVAVEDVVAVIGHQKIGVAVIIVIA